MSNMYRRPVGHKRKRERSPRNRGERPFSQCSGVRPEGRCVSVYAVNDSPQPQVDFAFGFPILKPAPLRPSTKSTLAPIK